MRMYGPWADGVIRQVSLGRFDIAWNPCGMNWLPPYFLRWESWANWDASFHFGPFEIRRRAVNVSSAMGESQLVVGWLKPKPDPLGCYDCLLRYGEPGWADFVVPDDVWLRISPTGNDAGILCATCMFMDSSRQARALGTTG